MTDKIRVIISNSQKEVKIPTGLRMLVRRCCNAVLRMENFQGAAEVSVTFANNEQIHELNKMHRNVDAPTDVLSFPMGEDGKYDIDPATNAKILGDIVISMGKGRGAGGTLWPHSAKRSGILNRPFHAAPSGL